MASATMDLELFWEGEVGDNLGIERFLAGKVGQADLIEMSPASSKADKTSRRLVTSPLIN